MPREKNFRELWEESVEDGFMGLYDHLIDYAKYDFPSFSVFQEPI